MTRSKLSSKVLLLVGAIGLSVAAFAGAASAQEYCPDGLVPDPSWGCSADYDYPGFAYGYLPYGGYDWHRSSGRGVGLTTVEAISDGWWYTAPLAEERRVLAFLTDAYLPAAA